MKVAFEVSMEPVNRVLIVISQASGLDVTESADADLVIFNKPDRLLHHLKNGKRVAQVLMPGETALTGLANNPEFADRFSVFGGADNFLDSLDRLVDWIIKKKGEFDENSGS